MHTPIHARAIWVGRCGRPGCRAVHIDLLDDNDEVVACAAIPVDGVRDFTENIKNAAYDIASESDG